jgi:hypothetical protein
MTSLWDPITVDDAHGYIDYPALADGREAAS